MERQKPDTTSNEIDLYKDWAAAVCHGRVMQRPSRRFAAGMIALRPNRDGHITGYEGLDNIGRKYGECIVASHLPDAGTPPVLLLARRSFPRHLLAG